MSDFSFMGKLYDASYFLNLSMPYIAVRHLSLTFKQVHAAEPEQT
jgi:hypothetical protein